MRPVKTLVWMAKKLREGDFCYVLSSIRTRFAGLDLEYASLDSLGLSPEIAEYHSPTNGTRLKKVLKNLPITNRDSVLDVGCGKGAALVALSRFPFRKIDGVDISPTLLSVAQNNIEKMKIRNVSLYCSNASDFSQLDEYTYFFMFNPFPAVIMSQFMGNLKCSLDRSRRRVFIIYRNPVCHDVIISAGILGLHKSFTFPDHEIRVYSNS